MQNRILARFVLAAASSILCLNAMAMGPGLYFGLMMGPATNTSTSQPAQVLPLPTAADPIAHTSLANPKSSQFGSSLFLGYKFNQYGAFEGGFTYFSGIQYVLGDKTFTAAGGTTARVRDVYVAGKIDYTYSDTVGIFAKIGAAGIYTTIPGGLRPTDFHTVPASKVLFPPDGLKRLTLVQMSIDPKLLRCLQSAPATI